MTAKTEQHLDALSAKTLLSEQRGHLHFVQKELKRNPNTWSAKLERVLDEALTETFRLWQIADGIAVGEQQLRKKRTTR